MYQSRRGLQCRNKLFDREVPSIVRKIQTVKINFISGAEFDRRIVATTRDFFVHDAIAVLLCPRIRIQ